MATTKRQLQVVRSKQFLLIARAGMSIPTQDTTETAYEKFERRQPQVPITRPFVSSNVSCSSNSSQSSSSYSSQLVNSGRVTRGSAPKRSQAAVTADEEDDNVDYFSVAKKGRKGKK